MKPIERDEVMGLADYETIRDRFRARVIDEKKRRRVRLGDRASALFENRDTVLLQIQEMLRTERITRPGAILHEIETYNEFIPGDLEISCTLMIEIDDKDAREAFLVAARGIEDRIAFVIADARFTAKIAPSRVLPDRASAVQYLKFALDGAAVTKLRLAAKSASDVKFALSIDHPAYRAEAALSRDVVKSLGEDFES